MTGVLYLMHLSDTAVLLCPALRRFLFRIFQLASSVLSEKLLMLDWTLCQHPGLHGSLLSF